MVFLLLESIFIYGQLDNNVEILIYTSTEFMNIIRQSHLYHKCITFEINDTYNSIDKACKARLDLFSLSSISRYEKIIYLDTDIVISEDIKGVFDIAQEETLYTFEEGFVDSPEEYWGRALFLINGDDPALYAGKTAFTSGILLFKNCDKIKNLFQRIKDDIRRRPIQFGCYDQPYIVYNACITNLYDNKALSAGGGGNIIHHFAGVPGYAPKKLHHMTEYMIEKKGQDIQNAIAKTKDYIDAHLLPIIHSCGERLEGNLFMLHHRTDYTEEYSVKQLNLSNVLLNKNIKSVLEIGFNSGFSTLLMLLSNPDVKVTCVDLGEHAYARPCFEKLKETFGERIEILFGDSRVKVLELIEQNKLNRQNALYDLIHIDGSNAPDVAECDIKNAFGLSRTGTILIMDDYNFPWLKPLWDRYIALHDLKRLNIHVYPTQQHDLRVWGAPPPTPPSGASIDPLYP